MLYACVMSERRTYLSSGILIGIGVVVIIQAVFGWCVADYFFSTLSSVLGGCRIDVSRHYIFNELGQLKQTHLFLILVGFISLSAGVIFLRRPLKKIKKQKASIGEKKC